MLPSLPPDTIFQQDGAPPHYSLELSQLLDEKFQIPELEEEVLPVGHVVLQIWLLLIFSYRDMSKIRYMRLFVKI